MNFANNFGFLEFWTGQRKKRSLDVLGVMVPSGGDVVEVTTE
jgi:hypothetical protein